MLPADAEDEWATLIQGDEIIVANFTATWCGPCKMLSPRLDAAVATAGDAVDLAIVDIDENAGIADQYGVQAVPTVIAMRGGEVVDKFVGLIDEDKLGAFVDKLKN